MDNNVRLIDANALIQDAEDVLNFSMLDRINRAETIDPETLRPTGRWEKHWCDNNLIGHMYEVCPNCRSCEILDTEKFWDCNYCPNCGADMRGEANGK